MFRKLFFYLILAAISALVIRAQNTPDEVTRIPAVTELKVSAPEANPISPENKKRLTEILRETAQMTAMLNSSDNRINYTLKTAATLWKLDEKEARTMLSAAMNDIRQIIVETDAEMNRVENAAANDGAAIYVGNDMEQKINRVSTLRSALINQIAANDPELGLNFLQDTIKMTANNELKNRLQGNDAYLEAMLIGRIAEKNPSKALELGRKKLSGGISPETIGLIQTIYSKDKEKGAAFAEDVLKRIKSSESDSETSWILSSLFDAGVSSANSIAKEKSSDQPLFSEESLRDLANMVAKQIADPVNGNNYDLSQDFVASMQKYAPQQIWQIKKMAELQRQRAEREKPSAEKPSEFNNAVQKIYESQSNFQSEVGTKIQGLTGENTTSEKRKKLIEEARSKISESGNKNLKFESLVSLAIQAANVGEKESAVEILGEAESLINLQPKDITEYNEVWRLAAGYAVVKPEKSFALVEDTILRLNDVINSFVKFSEFQSGEALVENGELKMGDYSGQMFGFFNYTGDLMGKLSDADFERTKGLADKFERPEFRVEARLMIADGLSKTQFNGLMKESSTRRMSR